MIIIAKVYVTINNNWVIPLGLSYYTFRNIHYTIEVYKGKIQQENLLHYLAYNFFLPSFIVGPINRYHDFIKDWNRRRFNKDQFSLGLERILYGSSKIIILGNYFFTLKANQFIENIDSKYVWLKTFLETSCFILNGFFKFAGYSDIAIGLSLLLGFRIMENFNYPFFATNMRDFWSRYHISLSSFCKDYIYTPIASHTRNATKAIIITMIVIGLWHEISIRYILWGIFQAIGIYSSSFIKINSNSFIAQYAGRLFVFVFFAFSCVIVSHDTLTEAINTYKILFFLK